jgi:hypothetical protein
MILVITAIVTVANMCWSFLSTENSDSKKDIQRGQLHVPSMQLVTVSTQTNAFENESSDSAEDKKGDCGYAFLLITPSR